ncbi:MAG: hypothetical protein AABX47_04070 [Nanoarchaeota archaeon]
MEKHRAADIRFYVHPYSKKVERTLDQYIQETQSSGTIRSVWHYESSQNRSQAARDLGNDLPQWIGDCAIYEARLQPGTEESFISGLLRMRADLSIDLHIILDARDRYIQDGTEASILAYIARHPKSKDATTIANGLEGDARTIALALIGDRKAYNHLTETLKKTVVGYRESVSGKKAHKNARHYRFLLFHDGTGKNHKEIQKELERQSYSVESMNVLGKKFREADHYGIEHTPALVLIDEYGGKAGHWERRIPLDEAIQRYEKLERMRAPRRRAKKIQHT